MRRAIVCLTLLVSVSVVGAQAPADLPAFELATIRPADPSNATMSIQLLPGGRLVAVDTPLSMLIGWAFRVDDSRLIAMPSGASARFDVVAQTPDRELASGEVYLMMQRLLAERFGLVTHRERQDRTTYALTAEPGGLKVTIRPAEPSGPHPFRMGTAGELTGTAVTADMLATVLAGQLGRSVANKTGIAGVFDFTLRWRPDERAAESDRPSLSTALREQLGLRLTTQTSPVDVIVIDRVNLSPGGN